MSTKRVPVTRSNSVSSKFITPPPDANEDADDVVPIATADLYDPNQDSPENPTLETAIQQAIREHYMMNASPLPTVSPVVSAVSSVPMGEAVDSDGVAPTGGGGQDGDTGTTSSGTGAKRGSGTQNRDESGRKKWIILAVVIVAVAAGVAGIVAAVTGGGGEEDPVPTPDVPNSPDTSEPPPPPPPPLTTAAPSTIRATSEPTASLTTSAPSSTPTAAPTYFPIDDSYVAVGAPLLGTTPLERFGDKVSMSSDGTIIAVGSPGHPHEGEDTGAVSVYQNRNGSWRPVGSTLFGGAAEEKFGSAVALSGDGSILVVGAPESFQDEGVRNPGFVRTFRLSTASQWEPIGIDLVGDSAGDRYGVSLALSRDGSTLVVGATQGADGDGYAKVYTRNNDEVSGWKHLRTFTGDAGDGTGYSVSVSSDGSFVAVGSDRSGPDLRGHVDVYMRSPNGIYVTAGSRLSGSEESDYFGESVSLSANGEFLAAGALFGNRAIIDGGQVRVYRRTPSSAWEPVGDSINGQFVRGFMGASVALSADGRTVVTSESGVGAGVVRVYHFDEVDWRLVGNSLSGGETNSDAFGHSVAISDSGRKIVVGAPRNSGSTGMVAVYEL